MLAYSIATADLLHELSAHPKHHPPKMLGFPASEQGPDGSTFPASITRGFDAVQDNCFLDLRLPIMDL